MSDASSRILPPSKGHPTVQRVLASWRRLTGGKAVRDGDRRTLLACSGGADSSALVLALASHPGSVVVAHIEHDMRPPEQARGCLEAARRLAESLRLTFATERIEAKHVPGNYEANARTLRYGALARLAERHGCRYIATAHHGDDQLETILLKLMRGAGPKGFSGIRARRKLGSVVVIRPMLDLAREDARALCRECGFAWSEDASNADLSRRRAALRATVLPALLAIEPRTPRKAAEAARLAEQTAAYLGEQAAALGRAARGDETGVFARDRLRMAPRIVLLTWLRSMDAGSSLRQLESIARAIASDSGETRQWNLGARRITLEKSRLLIA